MRLRALALTALIGLLGPAAGRAQEPSTAAATPPVTVTDVDLAGGFEVPVRPPQRCDARIYRDVDPPRIDLEFRLTDDGAASSARTGACCAIRTTSRGRRCRHPTRCATRSVFSSTGLNPNSIRAEPRDDRDARRPGVYVPEDRPAHRPARRCGQSRWLSFYLPSDEAGRLARVLKGKPCVPVLNLLGQVATAGNFEVIGAEIDGDERGVPATLVLSRGERVFKFGCHPADALVRRWLDRLSLTD